MDELTRAKRNAELRRLRDSEDDLKIAVAAIGMDSDTAAAIKNYFKSLTSLIAEMKPEDKRLFTNELEALRRVLK